MSADTTLRSRAITAAIWSMVIALAGTVMRFGSSMIMTRLLSPDVFGIVALSGVLFMIVSLLSDIGLRQCVIYSERGEQQHYLNTIWSLSALRGVFIAIISAVVALGVYWVAGSGVFAPGSVYLDPDLPLVLALTALSALWMGIKSPKLYLLERKLEFKKLAYIELISQLLSTLVTLWLTWQWRSVWAIVVGSHISTLVTLVLSHYWIEGPIGRLEWDKGVAKEVINYGRWILISSVAFVIAMNGDRLLLGLWVSAAMLGFYALALNIVSAVESIASRPFSAVAMPAFSEVARNGKGNLREVYFRFRLPFDVATVAAAGFLFATGQLIVDLVYDPRYALAGRTLQILSFSLLFPRFGVAAQVHAALGHPQTGSWVNIARLVSVFTLVPLGHALGGYEGAMWAISLHMAPTVLVTFWRNIQFGLNDFKHELKVMLVWPAGFALGWLANLVALPILHWLGWK
jgi:O-antigen/teichoic acid export membrane protein